MAYKRILSLAACLFMLAFPAFSIPEPSTAHIKVITVNEGLPDNSVNDLVEDDYGFIWIGTWNGLARFDGKYVTTYRHPREKDHNPLCDMVRCIKPCSDGLWVGNDTGLDFFSYSDGRFYPAYYVRAEGGEEVLLNVRVSHLLKLGDDIFALTINGDLMRWDRAGSAPDGTRPMFRLLPKPRHRRYADFTLFADGSIMALSTDGVTLLSADGERELFHNPIPYGYDPNLNLFFNEENMTVTIGGGVGAQTREFQVDRNGHLTACDATPPYSNLMSIAADGAVCYYGTDGNGMFVRDGDNMIRFTPDNSSMPCDAIYKVYIDSNHNLWVGSYRHGVFMLSHNLNAYSVMDKHSGRLSYDIVTAVIPDGDRLYLGLDGGGLEVLDMSTGAHRQYNKANSQLPADNVVSVVKDGDILWAAIYGTGLVECNLSAGSFRTFNPGYDCEPNNKLWVVMDDGAGNLWVGGNSLSVFNKQTHQFRVVEGTQMGPMCYAWLWTDTPCWCPPDGTAYCRWTAGCLR